MRHQFPYILLMAIMSLGNIETTGKSRNLTCNIKLSSTIAGAPKLCPISMKVGSPPVVKPCTPE